MTTREIIAQVTHNTHTLTVEQGPNAYGTRTVRFGALDGTVVIWRETKDDPDEALKVLRRLADQADEDNAIRPAAERVEAASTWEAWPKETHRVNLGSKPEVGSVCWGWGYGRMRRGIVESVRRTGTVVMAYTTPSNPGAVRRATLKPGEAWGQPVTLPSFMPRV